MCQHFPQACIFDSTCSDSKIVTENKLMCHGDFVVFFFFFFFFYTHAQGPVITYRKGYNMVGGGGGQVKFYPYKEWGQKKLYPC